MSESHEPRREVALILQGLYFLVTGIWPLLHIRSFMAITGPKVDIWLVRTFGALVAVCGAAILSGVAGKRVTDEMRSLGAGSATVLAMSDLYYVAKGRIAPTYLLDALTEVIFAVWGVRSWRRAGKQASRRQTDTSR
jgi:hypothetical protein